MRQMSWIRGLAIGLTVAFCPEAFGADAAQPLRTPEQVVDEWFHEIFGDDLDLNRVSKLTAYPIGRLLRDLSGSRQELESAWTQLDEAAKKQFGGDPLDKPDYRRNPSRTAKAKEMNFRITGKKRRENPDGFSVFIGSLEGRAADQAITVIKQNGTWRVQERMSPYRLFSRSALARWYQHACGRFLAGECDAGIGPAWDDEDIRQRVKDCQASVRRLCTELQSITSEVQSGKFDDADALRDRLGRMEEFSKGVAHKLGLTDKYQRYRLAIDLRTDPDNAQVTNAVFAFTRRGSLKKRLDGSAVVPFGVEALNNPQEQIKAVEKVLRSFGKRPGSKQVGAPRNPMRVTISIDGECSWQHLRSVVTACYALEMRSLACTGKRNECLTLEIPDSGPDDGHPRTRKYPCCYSHDRGCFIGMTGVPKPQGIRSPAALLVGYDVETKTITLSAGGSNPETLEEFAKKHEAKWKPAKGQRTGPGSVVFAAPHVPFKAVRTVMQRFRLNDVCLNLGNPPTGIQAVLELELARDGRVIIAGQPVAPSAIVKRLEREIKKHPDLVVIIRAPSTTPTSQVQELIVKAQAAGATRFRLRAKESPSP